MTIPLLLRTGVLTAATLVLPGCDTLFGPCIPDGKLPTVRITNPVVDTITVHTPSIVVEGIAEDNTGVESVGYTVNGRHGEPISPGGSRRASFSFTAEGLRPGRNEVAVYVEDMHCEFGRPSLLYVHYEAE